MADTKVSALTAATSLNLADYLLLVQAGSSLKIDIETLALKMPSRIIVNEASELVTAGAVATNKLTTKLSVTGTQAYSLAAGTHGMEKHIVCSVAASTPDGTITVTSGAGVSTIAFNAVGDSVHLKNVDGLWYVIGSNGVIIA